MSGRKESVMSGYIVRIVRSPRRIRQRFHVRIESRSNGLVLLSSENYRDHGHAVWIAAGVALAMRAEVIDDTGIALENATAY
jgi:hypothetical protein